MIKIILYGISLILFIWILKISQKADEKLKEKEREKIADEVMKKMKEDEENKKRD